MLLRPSRARVRLRRTLRALGPAMSRPTATETLRAAMGAGLALALCGAILITVGAWIGAAPGLLLIAPLGATAFLVFAVPNSPLAQPWSAVAGNGASAFVAISIMHLGLPTELAAALSVFGAILAMALLRAMHPPGAAVALATVLRPVDGIGVMVQLLADGGVQAAPVVEDSRLVGIVTRSDLIAVLARQTLLAGAVQKAA